MSDYNKGLVAGFLIAHQAPIEIQKAFTSFCNIPKKIEKQTCITKLVRNTMLKLYGSPDGGGWQVTPNTNTKKNGDKCLSIPRISTHYPKLYNEQIRKEMADILRSDPRFISSHCIGDSVSFVFRVN